MPNKKYELKLTSLPSSIDDQNVWLSAFQVHDVADRSLLVRVLDELANLGYRASP